MQVVETSGGGAVVTDVALASLRVAVIQQEQFSKLLAEVAKQREEDLGQQTNANQEQANAGWPGNKDGLAKEAVAALASQPAQPIADDKRGAAVDIKA